MDPMELQLQTIAILSAALVFLSKSAVDAYKKMAARKNGMDSDSMMRDLHRWHKPVVDPKSGQPRFLWYEDSLELRDSVEKLREEMERFRKMLERIPPCPRLSGKSPEEN
jgi:hypothetical protein